MMTLVKPDLPTVEDVVTRLRAGELVRIEIPAHNFDRRPVESLVTRVNERMKHHPIGIDKTHIGRTLRLVTSRGQPMMMTRRNGSVGEVTGRTAVAWKRDNPDLRLVVDIEAK